VVVRGTLGCRAFERIPGPVFKPIPGGLLQVGGQATRTVRRFSHAGAPGFGWKPPKKDRGMA
jgi:hypothetical protein